MIHLALSRANLVTLLTKLDQPESERTILRRDDDVLLIVTGESDEVHYADRNGKRGIMHPTAEEAIAQHAVPV